MFTCSRASAASRSGLSGRDGPTGSASSRSDSRARTSALPARARGCRARGRGFSGKAGGSFMSINRMCASLRTSVLSAVAAWTWWPVRWAKLDMSSPTLTAWALGPSEPPTSVSDGGLWAGVERSWTPVREDAEQSGSAARGVSLTRAARAYSPTPRAHEVGEYQRDRGDPSKPRPTLTGCARGKYSPTPVQSDSARAPEARATKAARGSGGVNLRQSIASSATSAESGSTRARRYSSTPAAQDGKNQTLPPSQAIRDALPGDLIRQLNADGQSPCSPDTSSTTGNSRGYINAAWDAQYMGYPDGWLTLSTNAASWLLATPSFRRYAPRSPEASSPPG